MLLRVDIVLLFCFLNIHKFLSHISTQYTIPSSYKDVRALIHTHILNLTPGAKECPSGATPTRYQNGRFVPVSDPQHVCKRQPVHERAFVEHVSDDSATMFYHWWRYFKDVSGKVAGRKGAMDDKLNHFFMERPPNTQFFHYFGLLSKFCWRRTSAIPEGTCFCEPPQKSNVGEAGSHAVLEHMLAELGIAATPPTRVRVWRSKGSVFKLLHGCMCPWSACTTHVHPYVCSLAHRLLLICIIFMSDTNDVTVHNFLFVPVFYLF